MELDKRIISAQKTFKDAANILMEHAYDEYDSVNEYIVYLNNAIESVRCELDHAEDELMKLRKSIYLKK